jgi:hypothetical protein
MGRCFSMTKRKKSPNLSVPVKEAPTGMTDDEFYKGDFIPEITLTPPTSVDSDMSELETELWSGWGWRKSDRGQERYKRRV